MMLKKEHTKTSERNAMFKRSESERIREAAEVAVDRIIKQAFRDARLSYMSLDQIVDLIHSLQIEETNYRMAQRLETDEVNSI